jgi:hypothetical protein
LQVDVEGYEQRIPAVLEMLKSQLISEWHAALRH